MRLAVAVIALTIANSLMPAADRSNSKKSEPQFQTSDRCLACHNGLIDSAGEDVSIGFHWRASIMANSSHDPYWQASARREVMDHPGVKAHIEDECSVCHMPITRYEAKLKELKGEIFSHLPLGTADEEQRQASDGVSCSVCHQITSKKLGTPESYNGEFVVDGPDAQGRHAEYGPYRIENGQQTIMRSSSEGYRPEQADHIRESELCATCHTLITNAFGPGGKIIGRLPEQMIYKEWLHSDYRNKQSCQSCHMPAIEGPVKVAKVLGEDREGARLHSFVGGNFLMLNMLNRYRDELNVTALAPELSANAVNTKRFLQSGSVGIAIENIGIEANRLGADVVVSNNGGHKLPTAFPARRAWLHFVVRDSGGQIVFESGALRADGSISGNDNDADPKRFEPHYTEISKPDEVEIYEAILGNESGQVTTGLLDATQYLKDNRILPKGFDKRTAESDVAVVGNALTDQNFEAGGDRIRYSADLKNASGPFNVEAEIWFEPIGYRWAQNLKEYSSAPEPAKFGAYYDSMQGQTAVILARATLKTK